MEKSDEKKMSEALFVNLVSSLYSSAMHFLGKIMNPATGKIEKNLEAAHTNIEILRMLREKTSGNLSEEESRILGDALSNMQLNYVDELEKAKKEESDREEKKDAGANVNPPGEKEEEPAEKENPSDDRKEDAVREDDKPQGKDEK